MARALLEKPFSQFTRIEAESGGLQKQLRAYVMFSVQFLRELQLLDNKVASFIISSKIIPVDFSKNNLRHSITFFEI